MLIVRKVSKIFHVNSSLIDIGLTWP